MKKIVTILFIFLLTSMSFTQVQNETTRVAQSSRPQFSMAGLVFVSLQNWSDLKTEQISKDASKLGLGFSGDLFAGVIFNEMFIGIGPHAGYNFWTYSTTSYGNDLSTTITVEDFGLDIGVAWNDFYITLGRGSGNVSVSASINGDSQSADGPQGIGYTRFGIGWFDGWFAMGISITNYDQDKVRNNLNRAQLDFGWAF